MATGKGKNRTRKEDNDQDAASSNDDYKDLPENDQQTLRLVKLVKTKLNERDNQNKSITTEDVEVATYNGRCELKQDGYGIKKWKNDPSMNIVKSSDELIVQSMAYAITPQQAAPILKTKQEQMDKTPRNSLESIIQPLKELQRGMQGEKSNNLFAAVLEIDQDKIDRADRMFFVEARRLLGEPNDYTLDEAHHQVQAIRLMHYQTNDEKKLRNFIEKCKTFDLAYAHLRELARDRVIGRSGSAAPSSTSNARHSGGSIIRNSENDSNNRNYNNSSPSSSSSLYNSDSNSNPPNRPRARDSHSQLTEDEEDNENPRPPDNSRRSLNKR